MAQNPVISGPKISISQNIGGGSYYSTQSTDPTISNELYFTEFIFGAPLAPPFPVLIEYSNSANGDNLLSVSELINYFTMSALATNSLSSANLQSYLDIINIVNSNEGINNTVTYGNFQSASEVLPHFNETIERNNASTYGNFQSNSETLPHFSESNEFNNDWNYGNFQSNNTTANIINPFNMGQSVTIKNT